MAKPSGNTESEADGGNLSGTDIAVIPASMADIPVRALVRGYEIFASKLHVHRPSAESGKCERCGYPWPCDLLTRAWLRATDVAHHPVTLRAASCAGANDDE